MKKPLFTGVCTALVTPFLGNAVNYPLLELLLGRQIAAGIEAVVLCGTTGESPTLSDCESWRFSAGAPAMPAAAARSLPAPAPTTPSTPWP